MAALLLLAGCPNTKLNPEILELSAGDHAIQEQVLIEPIAGLDQDFMRGVDVSSLAEIEKHGGIYYNERGEAEDLFSILKRNGVNWIRLRVWNRPVNERDVYAGGKVIAPKGSPVGGGNNSVEADIPLAQRAKKAGMKLLLDFHYSDFWADPAKQTMPQDWKGLDAGELNEAVKTFTKDSLVAFIKAGARPDMVQIGNELNGGFLWPLGKTWKSKGDRDIGGMGGFATLLKSAAAGVREAQGNRAKIKIMIHLANGGDNALYHSVFDPLTRTGLDFDVIGLSFYNYWHGSTAELKANLADLAQSYGKELVVVETAYGFTEDDADGTGNNFQIYSDEDYGYRPSAQGQASVVRDLMEAVSSVPLGRGLFYWEPAWIPVSGAGWRTGEGSSWENQAMFDFKGRVLPSMAVWNLVYGRGAIENRWGGSARPGGPALPLEQAEEIRIRCLPGAEPALPASVKMRYSDDSERRTAVSWEKHDWQAESGEGTVILQGRAAGQDAAAISVQATVELSERQNLIDDPSWENGSLGRWQLDGPPAACFVENNKGNARSGSWTYKYWMDAPFTSTLHQTFTGLTPGTYRFALWAMGGGGEKAITMFAEGYDGPGDRNEKAITNTGWKAWKEYVLEFPVSSSQLTVGIRLDAAAGCWGNFDDLQLYRLTD